MADEKRKIILKEFEPETVDHDDAPESIELRRTSAQSFWFGEPVTAAPGEVVEVSEKTARVAVESGKFEYAPETVEEAEAAAASNKGELTEEFPHFEKLTGTAGGITTLEQLNAATDEEILAIEGIGEKSLKQIRETAAKLTEGDDK